MRALVRGRGFRRVVPRRRHDRGDEAHLAVTKKYIPVLAAYAAQRLGLRLLFADGV